MTALTPIFCVVLKEGDHWQVEAEWPDGSIDLAAEFSVSRERVRQIEVRAFEKVQSAVKTTIARQEQSALEAAL